jgi:hypothetical protein
MFRSVILTNLRGGAKITTAASRRPGARESRPSLSPEQGLCHPDEGHRCAAVSDRRPSGSSYSRDMSEPLLPLRMKRNDRIKGSGAVTTSKQVEEANTFNITGYFEHV